jgi:hypothetical protein
MPAGSMKSRFSERMKKCRRRIERFLSMLYVFKTVVPNMATESSVLTWALDRQIAVLATRWCPFAMRRCPRELRSQIVKDLCLIDRRSTDCWDAASPSAPLSQIWHRTSTGLADRKPWHAKVHLSDATSFWPQLSMAMPHLDDLSICSQLRQWSLASALKGNALLLQRFVDLKLMLAKLDCVPHLGPAKGLVLLHQKTPTSRKTSINNSNRNKIKMIYWLDIHLTKMVRELT